MCGLAGVAYADSARPADRAQLAGMAALLRHRGPDSDGYLAEPGVGFAFRRLSIIDLTGGDQPILNEDGTLAVMCNGEIYNFIELRAELEARGHRFRTKSDSEVIVHLYEEHGPNCVDHLRGMFGFALWDRPRKRLLLARDRFGIKPMHYAETPQGLYFGSEQKPILAFAEGLDRGFDVHALKDLLSFGYPLGARTSCRGIRRLLPGHILLYEGGRVTTRQYWGPRFPTADDPSERLSDDEWAEALQAELRDSMRLHMRSDVPVGAWLSPGIDSSATAALAGELTDHPIRSFTIGFEDPHADETRRFPTLDRYGDYNLRNQVIMCKDESFELFAETLWYFEEHVLYMIPRFLLSQATAREVKVAITGEGADEMFGGYSTFRRNKLTWPLSCLPLPLRRLVLMAGPLMSGWLGQKPVRDAIMAPPVMDMRRYTLLYESTWTPLYGDFLAPALRAELDASADDEMPIPPPPEYELWHPFQQLQYMDMTIRMPEQVVLSLDRASMAHGLEARVPFLDHKLAAFSARIPVDLKMRGLREKYILRQALRDLLPREIVERRKRGMMTPTRNWWRERLPDFVEELLSESALRRTGIFAPDKVREGLDRHRQGIQGFHRQLAAVLAIQLRTEMFSQSRLIAEAGKAGEPAEPAPAG